MAIRGETYSIRDMCDKLRMSRRSFLAMSRSVPGRVRVGNSIRWHKPMVDTWLATRAYKGV